ncbi:MAG: DUF5134 domain-containing protein [Micropruina sp.]|uniref:DUF5134 domain-containing protein n=1 Tax=Micropruina sp. TaxID=2737536 RepID=UPI0039E6445A
MLTGAWGVVLTTLFAVVAGYSMIAAGRWATHRGRVEELFPHLNHALMGLAMIAMCWWPAGIPATVLQLFVFLGFAGGSGAATITAHRAATRVDNATHLAMNAAMAWMLLQMALSAAGTGGHGHGGAGPAMTGAGPIGALAAALLPVLLLAGCALWWLLRTVRSPRGRVVHLSHAAMAVGMAAMFLAVD